jgi:hypothetical protein
MNQPRIPLPSHPESSIERQQATWAICINPFCGVHESQQIANELRSLNYWRGTFMASRSRFVLLALLVFFGHSSARFATAANFADGQVISDFKGSDSGTWTSGFQPDHTETIVTADGSAFNNGVTKGTHAIAISRTFSGTDFPSGTGNFDFRWGSQMILNAAANPPAQAKINTLVDAINAAAPNGRIAFDVSFNNVDQHPNPNPGFLGFEMSIIDGRTGPAGLDFYQADFGFPAVPSVGSSYKGLALSVPISKFQDESPNFFGNLGVAGLLLQKNSTLTFGFSSNTNGNATFVIDNIRVQTVVPEPGTLTLFVLAATCLCSGSRVRTHLSRHRSVG